MTLTVASNARSGRRRTRNFPCTRASSVRQNTPELSDRQAAAGPAACRNSAFRSACRSRTATGWTGSFRLVPAQHAPWVVALAHRRAFPQPLRSAYRREIEIPDFRGKQRRQPTRAREEAAVDIDAVHEVDPDTSKPKHGYEPHVRDDH